MTWSKGYAHHHLGRISCGLLLSGLLLAFLSGCIHRYYTTERVDLNPPGDSIVRVSGLLRVHLSDGSLAILRPGADVGPRGIIGPGMRYGFARRDSVLVTQLPLDSVVGIEAFNQRLDSGKSVGISVLATLGTVVLTVGGLVAIACAADPKCFGSCPTVYTGQGDAEVLEAELFSYSIAPLLEGRDIDVLGGIADSAGVLRLNVRNEAMESHFINHIELLEVLHATDERALPAREGGVVAVRGEHAALRAADRDGRVVTAAIAARDSAAYATTQARLAVASESDLIDYIDLAFARPTGDSAAIVLRLRNSLMNTVLFYDMMLGAAGAQSLNWLGDDLGQIGSAVKLGRWWASRMGMRIAVEDRGVYREVARVPGTGPIAWSELAVVIPVPRDERELRVRVTFPADEWRIDRIAVAQEFRRVPPRTIAAARVFNADSTVVDSARLAIVAPDEDYLYTTAGDRFIVEFEAGRAPAEGGRTLLLSTQGYYTEWVRPAWIRAAATPTPFEPSDANLLEAMRRWGGAREEFETKFRQTRIPTR